MVETERDIERGGREKREIEGEKEKVERWGEREREGGGKR